jgi:hypothetical protein
MAVSPVTKEYSSDNTMAADGFLMDSESTLKNE